MTHNFEPPTVRQPRSPGSPGDPQLSGDEPATRLQRPRGKHAGESATTRQRPAGAPADPQTTLQRRSLSPADPPTRHQGPRPGQPPGRGSGVLGELAERFEPVAGPNGTARLGAGAEAEVWLVREREQDRLVALKLYRPDPLLDPEEAFDVVLRERLADPRLHAHVPELYGWGRTHEGYSQPVAWEAMEYFELGSLADLIQREAAVGQLPTARAREIVGEIVNALVFWEDVVGKRQIDLSPGNILVRRDRPIELVLSDFGGVRGTGLSQAISELQVKVGYMAPEALGNGNHLKSPYWSLGMICYQLVMGRSFISDRNEDAFRIILATDDIDVSAVTDPRWRLLIEGLLTRSIENRWGPDEVRTWLDDKSPDPGVRRSVRSARPAQTIGFAGEQFDDRRILAAAMTSEADRAAEWLKDGGAAKLRHWLATFDDHPFDAVHLAGVERDERRAHLAVSWVAATFLRDQRPHFRGTPIDLDGILRLAQDPQSRGFLHQVVDCDALRIAALHDCAHPRCGAGPCLELRDLGTRITSAATQAMERLTTLGPRLAGDSLAADVFGTAPLVKPQDIERLFARAAEVLASPERAARIAQTARRGRMPRADWWQDIARAAAHADHRTADGAAAICVAAELTDQAQAYRRAEDQRRRMTTRQHTSDTFTWIGKQFTRSPDGRQRLFATPRWIPAALLILVPLACFEPVYQGLVRGHHVHLNHGVMRTANKAMLSMQPYTRWSSDWLTPWLSAHWHTQPWKVYAIYPVVLILAIVLIRRARGGSAVRSWLALPAAIIGLIFGIGLVMQLMSDDLNPIWRSFAALSIGALIAPIVALIAVRVVAGRSR